MPKKTRRSRLAFLFIKLAGLKKIRSRIIGIACRSEGGQMHSATYRELMQKYFGVEIGAYSYGAPLSPYLVPEGTRVGNYCSLGAGITIFRRNHPIDRICQHPFFYNSVSGLLATDTIDSVRDNPLVIESDVWIGAKTIITPKCRSIGLGAVIAAGSVVTKDVPPFAIMAGVPARQISDRFPKEIQAILRESRWWEQPIENLTPVMNVFLQAATLENAQHMRAHVQARLQAG